jgi:hypothetical protein
MNKTFEELGYKAGDKVRCVYTEEYFSGYQAGDVLTLELSSHGALRSAMCNGSLGDWELVCDPSDLTWGDMTPEQQGALLLAHHQGKTIEMLLVYSRDWHTLTDKPEFRPEYAYRIKPEPVVVHHEMQCVLYKGTIIGFAEGKNTGSEHVLTYTSEDGVPVCSSVKLSKLT